MAKYYAGIGSRETPVDVLATMTHLAGKLQDAGYILRSGGAKGADLAFESGVTNVEGREIYLTENEYKKQQATRIHNDELENCFAGSTIGCKVIARLLHPNGKNLDPYSLDLHARNTYQILGLNLDTPVEFVICYTAKGLGGGGTGQAIRLAKMLNIPIIDFGSFKTIPDSYRYICEVLNLEA